MHSAFLWFASHYPNNFAADLVKPFVHPDNLPEFFWQHLMRDIEQLSRVTGKGLDEASLIIHLVLHNVLTKDPPSCKKVIPDEQSCLTVAISFLVAGVIGTVNSLTNKNAREHWEKEFNTHYIQPVLGNLDAQINGAIALVASDDQGIQAYYCY